MLGRPVVLALAFLLAALAGATVYALVRPAASGGVSAEAVRTAILERPEMIPEAMQALRDREMGKTVAANRAAITTPFGDAWKGSANPDVTVVAYMDYACGYCRQSLPMLEQLVAGDPKVRVVFRELPVLSAESRVARAGQVQAVPRHAVRGRPTEPGGGRHRDRARRPRPQPRRRVRQGAGGGA
jgi:protein-disulfide isomerase